MKKRIEKKLLKKKYGNEYRKGYGVIIGNENRFHGFKVGDIVKIVGTEYGTLKCTKKDGELELMQYVERKHIKQF